MHVVPECPFRVAVVRWQLSTGAPALTIICKATYLLQPGRSPLAPRQDDLTEDDSHWDDDPARSLRATSDLAPFKAHPEVVLVGHAFAPQQEPVPSLLARLVVRSVDKSIEVHADRIWTRTGELREGARFTKMRLCYEHAAAGPNNPVGIRVGTRGAHGTVAVPNLQPPGQPLKSPGAPIDPIGFGPIAPTWPVRREKLRRHAATWSGNGWNMRPLPPDFDAGYFNVAPPDQQLDALQPDERITLEGLHPDHPRLVTSLPGIQPRAVLERPDRAGEDLRLRADTLWIDTDRQVCTVVWRGAVPLSHAGERSWVRVTTDGGEALLAASDEENDATATRVAVNLAGETMPFSDARATRQGVDEDAAETTIPPSIPVMGTPLPFRAGSPWASAPARVWPQETLPRRGDEEGTGTVLAMAGPIGETMPFAAPAPGSKTPHPPAAPLPPTSLIPADSVSLRPTFPDATTPDVAHAPPPMIGPLATPSMVDSPDTAHRNDRPATAPLAPLDIPSLAEAPEPAPPLEAFPIERCAMLAASIAHRRNEAARILVEHHLSEAIWDALDKHWTEAIKSERRRGKTGLLKAYDRAYIDQLEKERGPIKVEEYARLSVARERGTTFEVLADLILPRGAAMRIERVWLDKIIEDPELGSRVRTAVEAERET